MTKNILNKTWAIMIAMSLAFGLALTSQQTAFAVDPELTIQSNGGGIPEMDVSGNGIPIPDGDTTPSRLDNTDFGTLNLVGSSRIGIFLITNSGTGSLYLTDTPRVTIGGTNAADFTIIQDAGSKVVSGGTRTFRISFDPSASGLRTATISIANDDADENPYNFNIQGTGKVEAPTNVMASRGTDINKVQVTWTETTGVTSYQVYRRILGSPFGLLGSPTDTSFDDTTASFGQKYIYTVRACIGTICSRYAAPAAAGWLEFLAPTDVTASLGTFRDRVQLTWTETTGATSYQVYRFTIIEGRLRLLGNPIITTFDDFTANPGVYYYYKVKACNGGNCTRLSAADKGWRSK
ncbi:MAG: choice-of-anchor D domain-containing protein [Chloroflexota bacterium]